MESINEVGAAYSFNVLSHIPDLIRIVEANFSYKNGMHAEFINSIRFFSIFLHNFLAKLKTSPTIVAKPDFDATAEAETLAEAIESIWSKDARTITSCLSGCSNEQRQQIAAYFAETMHQSLFEKLDEVTVGNMGRLVAALLDPPVNFLCKELHDALTEQKVDNGVLVEILCTKSGSEMKQITETYQACEWKPEIASIRFNNKICLFSASVQPYIGGRRWRQNVGPFSYIVDIGVER